MKPSVTNGSSIAGVAIQPLDCLIFCPESGRYNRASASVQLLNRVFENLAGPELGLRAGLDLDRLAGPRIAPGRGLAASHREIAETDQPHLVAALEGRGDDLEHRFN